MTACIDVHSHFFPLEVLDVLRKEGERYRTPLRAEADGRSCPGRVMLGSDFPFDMGSPSPRDVVESQQALTAAERARVYRDTAVEFPGARRSTQRGRTP